MINEAGDFACLCVDKVWNFIECGEILLLFFLDKLIG